MYWAEARGEADRKLALVNKHFFYCCQVVAGIKNKTVDIFGTSSTTMSRVLINKGKLSICGTVVRCVSPVIDWRSVQG